MLSNDPTLRFDALAAIQDHGIRSVTPQLREFARRSEGSDEPSAPYEWQKVNRLIGKLADDEPS